MIARLLALALVGLYPCWSSAREITVSSSRAIVAAVAGARAGDVITVAPGRYTLPKIRLRAGGDAKHPIVLRAAKPRTVELRSAAVELMKISGPYWTVENFDIDGICAEDSRCEHAFHIVGRADHTIVRGNRIRNFNAHIKGNGENGHFPNDVLIENNLLFDTRPRQTSNPIAAIDVVGGERWVVRGNLVADYGKRLRHPPERTDDWSYAVFLKGNSERGLIAGNIVGCDIVAPPTPAIRGISLGGSGTGPGLCERDDCRTEHRQGTIWGNLVFDCPGEPGIYLFQAKDTLVAGNIVVGTTGIEATGIETSGRIAENRVEGAIEALGGSMLTYGHGNTILGAKAARRRYLLPLLGKVPTVRGSSLANAAKLIARYRAYRAALTKP